MQPVIKWSGSKRSQATSIVSFFPKNFNTYYEPFIGGGSVLYTLNPKKAIAGDICTPLIRLWVTIENDPDTVAKEYRNRWNLLQEKGGSYYYDIRTLFNKEQSPYDLFFLTRTCVNGLIRFNKKGEFNSPFHFSRKGINPDTLEGIIFEWSEHIKNTTFISSDYEDTLYTAKKGDVVYLDPPYFNTKGMYQRDFDFARLYNNLEDLNRRGIYYILSFDGKSGNTNHTVDIPKDLYKRHEYIKSGTSPFKRIKCKESIEVFESLYMNFEEMI